MTDGPRTRMWPTCRSTSSSPDSSATTISCPGTALPTLATTTAPASFDGTTCPSASAARSTLSACTGSPGAGNVTATVDSARPYAGYIVVDEYPYGPNAATNSPTVFMFTG